MKNRFTTKLTFGLIFLGLAWGSCTNNPKDIPDFDKMSKLNSGEGQQIQFIFGRNGHTKASVWCDTLIQNQSAKPPYADLKKNLKMQSFDTGMQVESTLTANYARYFPKTGDVIIQENVKVFNKKGDHLETEELIWNQRKERFYTDKFVKITLEDQVTYGDGLEANQDFTWFKIIHQVGSMPINKEDLPPD